MTIPSSPRNAESIRDTIRRQSFDGAFFRDNAVREDGRLRVTGNRSEVCQYYAFFFDVADPQTYPELWRVLREEFGPNRKETDEYPDVHGANYFVGNLLRMELLSRYGQGQQVVDESAELLLYMAERTGTLWEHVDVRASCNQGFASHTVFGLYRDVLGVHQIDARNKTVHIRFADVALNWCEGRIPTPDGAVSMRWRKRDSTLLYDIHVPAGFHVQIEKQPGQELVRQPLLE